MFLAVSLHVTFKHNDLKRAIINSACEYKGLYDFEKQKRPVDIGEAQTLG